jgi:hypothetical protein
MACNGVWVGRALGFAHWSGVGSVIRKALYVLFSQALTAGKLLDENIFSFCSHCSSLYKREASRTNLRLIFCEVFIPLAIIATLPTWRDVTYVP